MQHITTYRNCLGQALGRLLIFSRPFSLCSSKATISRRSLNCSCLSKNIFSCYRIKPAPAPSFGGLSFSPPACKSGSRMRFTLELSSFGLLLSKALSVYLIPAWMTLWPNVDVLLTLCGGWSVRAGIRRWWLRLGLRCSRRTARRQSCRITVCIPQRQFSQS